MSADHHLSAPTIQQLRFRLGMSQQQFAAMLRFSTPTISRWENEHHPPTDAYSEVVLTLLMRLDLTLVPSEQVKRTLRSADDRTDILVRLVRLVDQCAAGVAA